MTKTLIFCLFLAAMAAPLWSQAPSGNYDLGWFDHRDNRSNTTGLGTLVRNDRRVQSHAFSLDDPASFKPKTYDIIVFGSFAELHPSWDRFVRAHKTELLDWVRNGGILVQMCRSRKSDRSEALKLNLLPTGFEVFRGSDDNDEFHASDDLLPLWRGIDDKYKEVGTGKGDDFSWYRRPGGVYGAIEHGPTDAFERWSSQFRKSAGIDMEAKGGVAFALHADYGQGQILLFQFTFDKYDGAENLLSQNMSLKFFDCLVRYGLQRPNPGKSKPVPIIEVPDPPRATKLKIEGRAFIDADRDGRYDGNERTLPGLTIRDLEQEVVTDANGRFSLERPIGSSGFLSILGLPAQLRLPGGWFQFIAGGTRSNLTRDFAFQERSEDRQTVVVASLPAGLDSAGAMASVEPSLILAAKREAASRLILFSGSAKAADLKQLRARLEPLFSGDPGFELFLVLDPQLGASQSFSPEDWAFDLGPWRFLSGSAMPRGSADPITVLATFDGRNLGSERDLVLLPQAAAQDEQSVYQALVPDLLDPQALEAESAYLVFESGLEGSFVRKVPVTATSETQEPRLPLHRWGMGKMSELLKQAREEAKD